MFLRDVSAAVTYGAAWRRLFYVADPGLERQAGFSLINFGKVYLGYIP